ncbi:MAG: hypothetical protein IJ390_14490 [Lachnospiraceae bacterium]|nr:hypothetical protein [Lachnospiraceae bacterium]
MKKIKQIFLIAICCLFISGCGDDPKLTQFHNEIDSFYESLSTSVSALENIDPASESAVDDMLTQLDTLSVLFGNLAAIEIPEEFENIEELADEASEYMTEAGALYREAYADNGYDDSLAAAAGENYNRAMKRINYIAILLQGRIPEGEDVMIVTEEETVNWDGGEAPVETQAETE